MRLFVALLPPADALKEVEEAVAPLREPWSSLRWVAPELWHVTLAFLGEVSEDLLPDLTTRLERAAARHARLTLSFAAAGAFPGNGAHARVVWAGVYGERRAFARLAAAIAAGARGAGVPADHRPQHPHLTLARCRRRPADVRPLIDGLSAFAGRPWTADAVHLMRSHQEPAIRYEPVASWPLRA
ncbi:RNA 2',3'-cyclic phosphodiesterase [Bailinhaonella thermotolerans]|uniref:RNA 2',3'-cyclic phosphodiesterase n=1 Tax=Bailinhaonella thermotolerans TaxID=1070861 RepID=A0A3A4AZS7_9ACTN|nr:RNA 2',3'-cyclic phosphodiesterase [Bailinhaonella thermotolerans]RJL33168.1 RNA 2',3'-cyclic phosphodiesterase [Bailinhaonella thermotolerans]